MTDAERWTWRQFERQLGDTEQLLRSTPLDTCDPVTVVSVKVPIEWTNADLQAAESAGARFFEARLAEVNRQLARARPIYGLAGLFSHTPETRRDAGICEACWGRSGYEPGYEELCRVCNGTQHSAIDDGTP